PAGRPCDEVDGQLFAALGTTHQLLHGVARELHRQQADLERVLPEDVAVGRRDDRGEAVILERPRRMLARRAAAEVPPGDQNARALGLGAVELEARILAPVEEEELAEAGTLDSLEELLRDDLVGVDVLAVEHESARGDGAERRHATASSSSRASAKCPAIA